jgi:hypothetical protein
MQIYLAGHHPDTPPPTDAEYYPPPLLQQNLVLNNYARIEHATTVYADVIFEGSTACDV